MLERLGTMIRAERIIIVVRGLGVGSLVAAALAPLFAPESAHACAVCFGDGETLAGFTVSWLFLAAMPFAVIGSIGGWVYWIYRRGQSQRAAEDEGHPALTQKERGI